MNIDQTFFVFFRKFRSQECLTEFEIYQKKVYSDVLKFEMIDVCNLNFSLEGAI